MKRKQSRGNADVKRNFNSKKEPTKPDNQSKLPFAAAKWVPESSGSSRSNSSFDVEHSGFEAEEKKEVPTKPDNDSSIDDS